MQPAFQQHKKSYASPSSNAYGSASDFQSGQTVKGYPGHASNSDIEILNTELAKILAEGASSAKSGELSSPFKEVCEQIDQIAERLTFSSSQEHNSGQKQSALPLESLPPEANSTFGDKYEQSVPDIQDPPWQSGALGPSIPASQMNTFRQEFKDTEKDTLRNSPNNQGETEEFVDLAQYITSKVKSPQTLNSGSDKSDLVAYFAKRAEDDMFLEDCGASIGRDRLKHMRSPDDMDNHSVKTIDESLFKNLMTRVDNAVESAKKQLPRMHKAQKPAEASKSGPNHTFKSEKIAQIPQETIESFVIKPKLLPEESLSLTATKRLQLENSIQPIGGQESFKTQAARPLPPIPKQAHQSKQPSGEKHSGRVAVATNNPKVLKIVSRASPDPVVGVSVETSANASANRHKLTEGDLDYMPRFGNPRGEGSANMRTSMAGSLAKPKQDDHTPSLKKSRQPGTAANTYLVEMRLAELSTKISYLIKRHTSHPENLLGLMKTVIEEMQSDTRLYHDCTQVCPGLAEHLDSLRKLTSDARKVLQSVSCVMSADDQEVEERKEIEKFLLKRVLKQAHTVIQLIQDTQTDIWRSTPKTDQERKGNQQGNQLRMMGEPESFDQDLQELVVTKAEERGLHRVPSVNSRLNFNEDEFGRQSPGKENQPPKLAQNQAKAVQTSSMKTPLSQPKKVETCQGAASGYNKNQEVKHSIYEQVLAAEMPAPKGQKHLAPCGPPGELLTSQKFGCRVFTLLLVHQKALAAGFEDGGLSIFSICPKEGLALLRSGKLHPRPITALCCSPPHHKRQLIFAGYAGSTAASVVVWDLQSMKALKELVGHTATISSLQFIEPGYLASTSFDRKVIFWDLEESAAVLAVETLKSPILTSMYDSESRVLYAGALDGAISALGLVFDDGPAGELADCVQLQLLAGQSPVLHLTSYLGDKLLAVQNAKIAIFDSRGIPFREIRTDTLPNSLHILSEDRGVLTDSDGKPYLLDMGDLMARGPKTPSDLKLGMKQSQSDNTSNLLALRLSGANCQAQFLPEGAFQTHGTIVVSVGEKHDTVFLYRIR